MAEYTPRLQKHYKEVVVKELFEKLGTKNIMQVPSVIKVVLNMGIGSAKEHANWMTQAVEELTTITGQKPVVNKAKTAISNFANCALFSRLNNSSVFPENIDPQITSILPFCVR